MPIYDEGGNGTEQYLHKWIHVSLKIERDDKEIDYSKLTAKVVKTVSG